MWLSYLYSRNLYTGEVARQHLYINMVLTYIDWLLLEVVETSSSTGFNAPNDSQAVNMTNFSLQWERK